MHGDFTRWTHQPRLAFRSVLMQQGRVLLDAEWNEQTSITAHHDEARAADIIGPAGAPEPLDGGPGPFAVVDLADGSTPAGVGWDRLGVTPGDYYVDGVLAESEADPDHAAAAGAWPLADQPHLPTIGSGVAASLGLDEPSAAEGDGRYVAYLDVWSRLVTADEDPALLESALGGPDTAARERTVWQVRLERLDAGDVCSTLSADGVATRAPRTLAASLRPPTDDTDPCQITAAGGYQRLENQLYRVQIHDVDPTPRFLWSRENGSVVARLVAVDATTEPGMDAALTLDRVGRDDELSIRQGDVVEVTSTDRQLRGLSGFVATAGPVDDLVVNVAWADTAPTSVASLGEAPVVRRWEGGPTPLSTTNVDLEAGIVVRFPTGGTPAIGDYWLLPARTVRLAYGTTALRGTLEWPERSPGVPEALPPLGPVHHTTPLAILARTGTAWTQESDCRHLFPPLTELVTIDLVGGDGQEAMPGDELAEQVRVVVRNGGLPVVGAPVRFTAHDGRLRPTDPGTGLDNPVVVETAADGVAAVSWTLDPAGTPTQTLVAERLDDLGARLDVQVIATGRLSIASQVQWDPVCKGFSETRTVQDALGRLVRTPMLRLLGGDGQEVSSEGETVPQHVRVVVDSPCGPVKARVRATGTDRALVLGATQGDPVPGTLLGSGATSTDVVTTDGEGVATFVWQPGFLARNSDLLTIALEGTDGAAVQVTAQLDQSVSGRTGLHVKGTEFGSGRPFENDDMVTVEDLASGIVIVLDGLPLKESVDGKPVGRVLLDLQWPLRPEGEAWFEQSFGFQTVELFGEFVAKENVLVWEPQKRIVDVLVRVRDRLVSMDADHILGAPALPIRGRVQIDGWAVIDAEDESRHLNGHAETVSVNGQTVLKLPTTDDVAGGRFEMWFFYGGERLLPPFHRFEVQDFAGATRARVEKLATGAGLDVTVVEEDAPGVRKNSVLGTLPAQGARLVPGQPLTIRVARGAGG